MEIKVLNEADYLESMKLSMYAFQYKIAEDEVQARKEKLKKHHITGIWDGESLAAKLHIIPLKVLIGGVPWEMGGVAGVATYPEYRRRGYVKQLLIEALKNMKDSGQIVSLLHPFDIGFYRQFGWELFSENKKIVILKENLRMLGTVDGTVKRYTKDTHHPDIEKVYQTYSLKFDGMLMRDNEWWTDMVYHDAQIAVYYDASSEAQGYILYQTKDKVMDVQEIVAVNQEARLGLWNFICQHDSMVEKVHILMSIHESFPYFIDKPNVHMELYPYFMARLVDVLECLKKYPFTDSDKSIFLHVEDHYAHWNAGTYMIGRHGIKTFPIKEGAACTHPPQKGISLSINELSAILLGYKRPLELFEMGYLKGSESEIQVLEEMIPHRKSFFYDYL